MKVLVLNPPNLGSQYINRDLMGGLGVNVHVRERWSGSMMSFLQARGVRLPVMSLVYSATVMAEYHDVTVLDAAKLELDIQQTLSAIRRAALGDRLRRFTDRYNQTAAPFDWRFATGDLAAMLERVDSHDHQLSPAA